VGVERFEFDLGSARDWIAAERHALSGVPVEWVPVVKEEAFRCAAEVDAYFEDVAREARELGVLPLKRPPVYPTDSRFAMLAATYARQIGKVVAFSLAAFRQAYNGGRDLAERDTVLLAGAAAEIHPNALVKGAELKSTAERLGA
jgi:2-hydroxychromene-2-carboxylate isomerase